MPLIKLKTEKKWERKFKADSSLLNKEVFDGFYWNVEDLVSQRLLTRSSEESSKSGGREVAGTEFSAAEFSVVLCRRGGALDRLWTTSSWGPPGIGSGSVSKLFIPSPRGAMWRKDTLVSRPLWKRTWV